MLTLQVNVKIKLMVLELMLEILESFESVSHFMGVLDYYKEVKRSHSRFVFFLDILGAREDTSVKCKAVQLLNEIYNLLSMQEKVALNKELQVVGFFSRFKQLSVTDDSALSRHVERFTEMSVLESSDARGKENLLQITHNNVTKLMRYSPEDLVDQTVQAACLKFYEQANSELGLFINGVDTNSGVWLESGKKLSNFFLEGFSFLFYVVVQNAPKANEH